MKAFWKSKTLWVNVLAVVGSVAEIIPAEASTEVLAITNIVLRALTKGAVGMKDG